MVMKNIAHVVFGYPAKRKSRENRKPKRNGEIKEDSSFTRETVAPAPRPLVTDEPVGSSPVTADPLVLSITDADKEKAAEALLTVIENGEVKGTVAGSPVVDDKLAATLLPEIPQDLDINLDDIEDEVVQPPVHHELKLDGSADEEENAHPRDENDSEAEGNPGGDLMAELFSQEEEKEQTAIGMLIDSLDDVSSHELVDIAEEVMSKMYAWQKKRKEGEANRESEEQWDTAPSSEVHRNGK